MTSASTPPAFLVAHLPARDDPATSSRPHITVTWAQSLDAKIAGVGGSRVILSGPESMLMTHWMRSMHDAILVGVNTIILDNPRLKIQLLPGYLDGTQLPPQPLILDPNLRFPLNARLLQEWAEREDWQKVVRQPWVICGRGVGQERIAAAEAAGARVISIPLDAKGRIRPNDLPGILKTLGLRSVMIEGGSKILSSFLHAPRRPDGSPLVDSVIVTVAPMFIGEGIGVVPQGEDRGLATLETVHTGAMGKDAVMVCKIAPT